MRTIEFLPRCLLSASLLVMCACTEGELVRATDVVVVVYSDPALERELTSITVEVLDENGTNSASTHEFQLSHETHLPLSFGVFQPKSGAEWFMLVTRGLGPEGKKLVEYTVIAHFEPHKTGLLQVYLGSACTGNFCDEQPGQTCQGETGQCVDVQQVYPPIYDGQEAGLPVLSDFPDPPSVDAGDADAGSDAGLSTTGIAVPPTTTGFASLGGRRTDGAIVIYDDGFERGARSCTADGQFCVTGGFEP